MEVIKRSALNTIALLATLGLKLGKVIFPIIGKLGGTLIKLLKGGSLAKVALGGASFAAYAALWDWRFAILILVALGFHESGHVWAMKRTGVPTKGFYFIPFAGALALSEKDFEASPWTHSIIAIMGPLWGFALTLLCFGMYKITGLEILEVAACWMAFLNLLNLIPLYPLDGGRLLRAITGFRNNKGFIGLGISTAVNIACLAFCGIKGYWVFFAFCLIPTVGLVVSLVQAVRRKKGEGESEDVLGQPLAELLPSLRELSKVPDDAKIEQIVNSLGALCENQNLQDELARFGSLRERYQAWDSDYQSYAQKLARIWNKPDYAEVLKKMEPADWKDKLTEEEMALADRLRVIVSEMNESWPALSDKLLQEYPDLLADIGVKPFSRYDDGPWGYRFRHLADGGHLLLWDEWGFHKEEYWGLFVSAILPFREPPPRGYSLNTARLRPFESDILAAWLKPSPFLIALLATDPLARKEFLSYIYENSMLVREDMRPWRVALVAFSYLLLVALLFLVMEVTGGSEAAYGAVRFFKSF